MPKYRFIAGAQCPKCQEQDSLRVITEGERRWVECVCCDYQDHEPEAAKQEESGIIGRFKP
ncbi:YheV family putative zinc ribbon protein [Aliagarivorans taiwanensis]|uniref:YheV family putative zinc ribbon protein n=1 Tax=Aliagarivorans taiwanensis TaxID=561966 RepID=UPI00041B7468|nr:YheV family putative zinc ribbon protein [Aliagarivorans taiwanensis]